MSSRKNSPKDWKRVRKNTKVSKSVRTYKGHIRTYGGHIRTYGGHIRTYKGHIRTYKGHIRTYKGHIRTHGGHYLEKSAEEHKSLLTMHEVHLIFDAPVPFRVYGAWFEICGLCGIMVSGFKECGRKRRFSDNASSPSRLRCLLSTRARARAHARAHTHTHTH